MKIEIFKEKIYDLVWINKNNITYFKVERTGKILASEIFEVNLFSQGIFQKQNLESGLSLLIKKHQLKVLGIVLNLPNILYQRVTLPRTPNPYEAILNYIKVSLPLSLEKYTFFYKEDKYKLEPTVSNFHLTFASKEVIDHLMSIINKHNLIPLFIVPSLEAIFQYILAKPLIDFNDEYIVFFLNKEMIITFLIKNLRIEKIIHEEIDLERVDLNLVINRFYNFFKSQLSPEGKILFLSEEKLAPFSEISHQQLFFVQPVTDILIGGSKLIFEKVFSDQEFIDFLPIKSYSAYFFNRLPSIIIFLSIYLFAVFFVISGIFLSINLKLKNNLSDLNGELKTLTAIESQAETEVKQILEIPEKLDLQIIKNFDKINKILNFNNFEKISLENFNKINFFLKVKQQDIERVKFEVSRNFPEVKLIQEEALSPDEVRLNYSF